RGETKNGFTAVCHVNEVALHVVDLCERRFGARAQMFAEPSRNHSTPRTLEERTPDPSLQIGQLMAQRRLGEKQLLAGAREVALLRNGGHEAQIPDLETHEKKVYRRAEFVYD